MKLSVALFAAAYSWDQPAWKDVQAALNDEGGRVRIKKLILKKIK